MRKQDPPLPTAVRWLGSGGLFRALRSLARLAVDGDAIDARDWMQPNLLVWVRDHLESRLDPADWDSLPEPPPEGALWFDYVADTGDDGQATLDLAYLLQGDLWVVPPPDGLADQVCPHRHPGALHLPLGDFLVLGGDTAYPVATAEALRTHLSAPWEGACQQRRDDGLLMPAPRPLLGIPGNQAGPTAWMASAAWCDCPSQGHACQGSGGDRGRPVRWCSPATSRCSRPRTWRCGCPGGGTCGA